MAFDKVIDSTLLDANLTAVADAIRAKGGTTEALPFPDGFVSAVEGIQTEPENAIFRINTISGIYVGVYLFKDGEFVTEAVATSSNTDGFNREFAVKIGDVICVRATSTNKKLVLDANGCASGLHEFTTRLSSVTSYYHFIFMKVTESEASLTIG